MQKYKKRPEILQDKKKICLFYFLSKHNMCKVGELLCCIQPFIDVGDSSDNSHKCGPDDGHSVTIFEHKVGARIPNITQLEGVPLEADFQTWVVIQKLVNFRAL
jgi:hypothetical protein